MTAVPTPITGRELLNPPSDGITNLRFSNTSGHLLVSSWDKVFCWRSVRWYDATANVLKGDFRHGGAVLDCCFHGESSGFIACLDNNVWRLVFNYSKEDILRRHDGPVRCVEYSYATGQVITGSWDKTLKCWDPRVASGQEHTPVGTYAFKCHQKSEAGRDIVSPVNAITFHPIYGTFATGGCDGIVNVWDGNFNKRLYQCAKYPTSIAALSFSSDGQLLAVASSYTFLDLHSVRNVYDRGPWTFAGVWLRGMALSKDEQKVQIQGKPVTRTLVSHNSFAASERLDVKWEDTSAIGDLMLAISKSRSSQQIGVEGETLGAAYPIAVLGEKGSWISATCEINIACGSP
ncbi:hypothetical protein Nepgr_019767 [Nepenthes gracilis]|uniref:Uncharacterized protein n=1 Tax=Nepenthes gracilis TaxID=150966 RepID=A0AAD3XVN8_NEPGR|nr:hypothetical protein Nepgr_019767 [Nepenthes gracilis]